VDILVDELFVVGQQMELQPVCWMRTRVSVCMNADCNTERVILCLSLSQWFANFASLYPNILDLFVYCKVPVSMVKKVNRSRNRPWRPIGLWDVQSQEHYPKLLTHFVKINCNIVTPSSLYLVHDRTAASVVLNWSFIYNPECRSMYILLLFVIFFYY
jgi:hypothetical protein